MDAPIDGQTDGRGRTDGRDGRMDTWTDGRMRDAARANAQSSTTTLVSGLVPEHAATKKRSDNSRMPPLYDSDNVYDNVCLAYDNVCIYV